MKFYVKKYNFTNLKRFFLAIFISILLFFILSFGYLSLFTSAFNSFSLETKINILMNYSRILYSSTKPEISDITSSTSSSESGSWLSAFEEEDTSSPFDFFGAPSTKKEKKLEKAKKEEDLSAKYDLFSKILEEVISNYGTELDESLLKEGKVLNEVQVIEGSKLIVSSDLEKLRNGEITIRNLFRAKKDSGDNNFVVEERYPGFFADTYDRVTKIYLFKDVDLTVSVSYIQYPVPVPWEYLIIFLFLALLLSLPALIFKFIPERFWIYGGIVLIAFTMILSYSIFDGYISNSVLGTLDENAKFATDIYNIAKNNGVILDTQLLEEGLSKNTGDILAIKLKFENDKFTVDQASYGKFVGMFKNVFIVFLITISGLTLYLFYLFSKGFIENFLNAIFNYSFVYIFVISSLILLFLLFAVPFIFTVVISFTSLSRYLSDLNLARQFVGLFNYREILDLNNILAILNIKSAIEAIEKSAFFVRNFPNFYQILVNTFLYTFISVLIQVTLGVVFAVILNDSRIRFRTVYQVLFIIPWVIPTYISALLWREALGEYGIFKQIFDVIGLTGFNIHADSTTYFLSICFVSAWYAFPFIMIVALSGLQGISQSVTESALLDGAGWFRRLFSIYLPLIRPTLLPSVLLTSIWTFNNFNIVYLYTRGNDNYDILITRIYDFVSRPDLRVFTYGYAAAYSVLVFIILFMYILAFVRLTKLTEKAY